MKRDQFLLTSSLVQFALFIPLVRWARTHPQPPVEFAFTHLVQKKQSSFVHATVKMLNIILGSATTMNVLVAPVAAVLWRRRMRVEASMMLSTCWMGGLVRATIKQGVDRPRPNPLLVHATKQSRAKSFPSGDVASSVCVWGWLFALGLLAKNKAQPARRLLLSVAALSVAFIGPARVCLGDHWATDVLGGYLYGGGWLSLSLCLYLRLREQGTQTGEQSVRKSRLSVSS
jgi:membrane-associated phospholipid phosphatase